MSFPRKLQILIIEDDHEAIEGYKLLLDAHESTFPHSPPVVARSLAEAKSRPTPTTS